jgi:DNA-binding NtrC family response regulator
VCEARNCLARMALLASDDVLGVEQLPASMQDEDSRSDSSASTIRGAERLMVLAAIRREGGNISRAARSLGIARTTLIATSVASESGRLHHGRRGDLRSNRSFLSGRADYVDVKSAA